MIRVLNAIRHTAAVRQSLDRGKAIVVPSHTGSRAVRVEACLVA